MANEIVNTPACGRCEHCDQNSSAFERWCSVLKRYVPATCIPCAKYNDIWQQDLFGNTTYHYMKLQGKAV